MIFTDRVTFLADKVRHSTSHGNGTMSPTSTADGNHQGDLALGNVLGQKKGEHFLQMVQKGMGLLVAIEKVLDAVVHARMLAQAGNVVRIGEKANVHHQVSLNGNTIFKSRGEDGNAQGFRGGAIAKEAKNFAPKL